ncbi:unannotated protein [freshwater metagenome]|uniref:Unannotated protein n=1 Tax=freshwater metagenome TaxID=449393 RepID=A0A6J7EYF6_9ZZZZ|nr:amino acid adenylation domain-containing protein [Actinomycetota bacterium]
MTAPSVFQLFAEQAAACPDAIAIVDSSAVTYGELAARSLSIAMELTARGIVAEQPVGVHMPRSWHMVAAMLGVMAAGGAYVPLDPDEPPERTRQMLRGAGCVLVLSHGDHGSHLRAGGVDVVDVGSIGATASADSSRFTSAPGGDRLAYVIFTSGSTGSPKGVEIEHRSVVNLLHAARDLLNFTAADRYLAVSTVGFDISVAELFLPLVTGASLLLRDRGLLLEPARLASEIAQHDVTVFQTGPSVWSILLSEVPDIPRLRVAITTGEAVTPELAMRIAEHADHTWNLYGPTEATVWATGHRVDPRRSTSAGSSPTSSASAPIGRALEGVRAIVVDQHGDQVSEGVEGELWLGGVAVARGYRANEALNAERFVTRHHDAVRYYRTGDVAVCDAEGVVHYLGRNDDQIKIHGVRIEPLEVETAVLAAPGVSRVGATWFESRSGTRSVVAAIVLTRDFDDAARQIYDHLVDRLPGAMIPSRFVFVDELPLSSSGKVDRNAIRALAGEQLSPAVHGSTRRATPTEVTLIEIWQRTLGIQGVAVHDHFFSVGGDSLAAVTMMLDVEEAFQVVLSVRVLFESPTIEKLAARVDQTRVRGGALANSSFVFPLVETGAGPPMFFGEVDLKLAKIGVWSAGCPLYSISHWAQGNGFAQVDTMEELATLQIAGIRQIQPAGPYRIAGYSFGGLVALAVAHELRRQGDEIALLFLLDPMEPNSPHSVPERSRGIGVGGGAGAGFRNARGVRTVRALAANPKGAGRYLQSGLRTIGRRSTTWQWLNYRLVHLHGRRPNPVSLKLLPKDRWPAFWYASQRLARGFAAEPFDGPTLAIFLDHGERYASWKALLGPNATLRTVESSHLGVFSEPAFGQWSEELRAFLTAPRIADHDETRKA